MRSNNRRVRESAEGGAISPSTPSAPAAAVDSDSDFELERKHFPLVPLENRPREIVFDVLSDEAVEWLRGRGYAPILLRTLPRSTDKDEQRYFMLMMQGIAEATIKIDKSRETGIMFELRSRGYLGDRLLEKSADRATREGGVRELLAWGQSRHSFAGNTTIVEPEKVAAFVRAVVNTPLPERPAAVAEAAEGEDPDVDELAEGEG